MTKLKNIAILLALLLLAFTTANAGVSFNVGLGSGGYYQPVGDYDYLPYAYQTNPGYAAPTINFHDMMGQYGIWVNDAPFGQVWKPYASNDWRPYTQGHWISTQQYGQMWEGYEPWAWAGYHYGNWVYSRNNGWVWIPGYDWHAGRVTWARSYDSIGWSPSPPSGYDYSRGYLSNVGPYNQYSYNDNDFGMDYGSGNFGYGGPYYDPRYRNMYYNQPYNNMNFNLWIFINNEHYGYDNYSNYYLGRDYTRHVFDRRMVRISNRPIDRNVLERLVGQRIQLTPVEVRQFRTEKQAIRVVVPTGKDDIERVRKNSKVVVRDIIAPGFAEKQKTFKGQNSKNKDVVSRIFHQENVAPKVDPLTYDQVIKQARDVSQKREQGRMKIEQAQTEKLVKLEKQGKLQEPKKAKNSDQKQNGVTKQQKQDAQIQSDAGKQKQQDVQKQNDKAKQKQQDAQIESKAAKQKQYDVQKQNDKAKQQQNEIRTDAAKQKQQDVQKQNDKVKQKQQDTQAHSDAAKQKQHDVKQQDDKWKQEDMESSRKDAKGKDAADKKQIDSSTDSNAKDVKVEPTKNSQEKSKEKKAKAKSKDKDNQKKHDEDPSQKNNN